MDPRELRRMQFRWQRGQLAEPRLVDAVESTLQSLVARRRRVDSAAAIRRLRPAACTELEAAMPNILKLARQRCYATAITELRKTAALLGSVEDDFDAISSLEHARLEQERLLVVLGLESFRGLPTFRGNERCFRRAERLLEDGRGGEARALADACLGDLRSLQRRWVGTVPSAPTELHTVAQQIHARGYVHAGERLAADLALLATEGSRPRAGTGGGPGEPERWEALRRQAEALLVTMAAVSREGGEPTEA